MAELLLELFSEEIPARMQQKAADDLKRLVTAKLDEASLTYDKATAYVTVRRLALHIEGLASEQPDVSEERRGPRADAPEKAIDGFLKGAGVSRDQVEIREEKKGTFLYAVIEKKGRPASEVLAEFLPEIIRTFPWPKSQRWGAGSLRWVRPLHSVLCLLDGDVVGFDLGDGLVSGNTTRGHRFLAPDSFEVSSFADYQARLGKAYVVLDTAVRKERILFEAKALAESAGLELLDDPALLDEIAGLAEYPVILLGEFDEEFLDVPQEALTSAMRSHQKYFSLVDSTGKLANKFVFVSNMKTDDHGAKIIDGNQRVLRARLADTKFFWDQDLKGKLEDNLPKLQDIVFHAEISKVGERVGRLVELSAHIAELIGADVDKAKRAAQLCKADLVSGMVGEFADLQGLMGKYYAEAEGEAAEVAQAIAEHYSPKGPSDKCPSAPVSIAVALAEKVDTLAAFFYIGEKPTGSKDPYALRRAALGCIRLILENGLRLSLADLTDVARDLVAKDVAKLRGTPIAKFTKAMNGFSKGHYTETYELLDFYADRLKVQQREQGVRHDMIEAVFSLGGEDDLVRLLARVEALKNFLDTEDGTNLLAGYKRAVNIVKIEEKKDDTSYDGEPTAGTQAEETTLFNSLGEVSGAVKAAVDAEQFEEAMAQLATLRQPIDDFFDRVTVNSENSGERQNRLRILSQIRKTMNLVADFSNIEG
ncbi:glycine--tRNA ligase subunit beta [Emcibacter nanhaiensis]|uniref:Glycine--tRNA ligase beta subunit n=1 Tax=Emcibacter nanhaiensis TaxID=1505037 RepID=A0A501PBT5_9PROT|nr:glycine--tRNA ligase subunit beta [Emcibacter nanhaiensis]TPD57472.1 glycine--tRNA ligase subunit beta [Emcibacter nanhaiensis]